MFSMYVISYLNKSWLKAWGQDSSGVHNDATHKRGQYPAIFMTSLISVKNLFYDLFLNNLIFSCRINAVLKAELYLNFQIIEPAIQ